MPIIQLENWRYVVHMLGNYSGRDAWRLTGKSYGHPDFPDGEEMYPSTPIQYDADTRQFTTKSGRTYKLGICDGDEEKELAYLLKDVETGGTQTW